jgi:hypothetical protein
MADRLLAEFSTRDRLAGAIRVLRDRGYRRLDAYTPYSVEEVEEALGLRRSRLPLAVFAAGLGAAGGAYFLQWFLNAYLYPLNFGGRPPHFPLPFLIITFEMGILFAGLTAFAGVIALGRLLRLHDPPQSAPGFESATRDRFWLEVSMRDDEFDPERTLEELVELGADRVELPEEDS